MIEREGRRAGKGERRLCFFAQSASVQKGKERRAAKACKCFRGEGERDGSGQSGRGGCERVSNREGYEHGNTRRT